MYVCTLNTPVKLNIGISDAYSMQAHIETDNISKNILKLLET